MIVYGDPSYEEDLGVLVARLQMRVTELADTPTKITRDVLRSLLIEAGQLEQAAQDASAELPKTEAAQLGMLFATVTDWLAEAFYEEWDSSCRVRGVTSALRGALGVLDDAASVPDVRVTVKLPEGYAFYALYPEQYAEAARHWAADHVGDPARAVVVIGIRSIGTSLSALIKTVLETEGRQVRRLTVRPTGPPYERQAELPALVGSELDWALVVDEGPGQSGSSMASVAEALVRGGMVSSRICFFPGHGGEPGVAASNEVRNWWARARRYVVPPSDLRWEERSLAESLAALTQGLCASKAPVVRMDDLGGGLWRGFLGRDAAEWPASCLPFERPKYRCVLADGAAVLWKYEGLAAGAEGSQAEVAFRRQEVRAREGWTVAPLGVGYGFVAMPWVEGQPLSRADAGDPATAAHLGRYVAAVAGPSLPKEERRQAVRRLGKMLYWNVWEAQGEALAERTRRWSEVAGAWEREHHSPSYGDGRMAPYEWFRTGSGRLVKTDSGGHDADHTVVGRQSVSWDLAGAMVEWGLDSDTARPLLQAYRAAGGALAPDDVLTFYRLAYAAFRLGQCAMSADMSAHDPAEQGRLWQAVSEYTAQIQRLLERATPRKRPPGPQ